MENDPYGVLRQEVIVKKVIMRKALPFMLLIIVLQYGVQHCSADQIRLANGRPVAGDIKQITEKGILLKTTREEKIIPWKYLSAGTRHRYEPLIKKGKANSKH